MTAMQSFIKFLKEWTLPVAITVGISLYALFTRLPALIPAGEVLGTWVIRLFPATVFLTLWATFCKVDFSAQALRPARWSWILMFIQLTTTALLATWAYFSEGDLRLIAMGAMACTLAPCATAASIVTAKLGGDISKMTAHILLSSFTATLTIPFCASLLTPHAASSESTTWDSSAEILGRVAIVLALPLILGWVVRHVMPPLHRWALRHSNLPFYLWGVTLAITTGVTVYGIDHTRLALSTLLAMAVISLFICLAQFAIGRRVGSRCAYRRQKTPSEAFVAARRAEGGQALGQKNTALIIWATTTFLHPAAALAPGCYVLWQNIVNSLQIHKHSQKKRL